MGNKKYKYPQVKVNFSPEEFEKLELLSADLNKTKAEILRNAIGVNLEDVRKPTPKSPQTKEIKVDANWRYEINRIGNNLNQAVEAMHTSKALIELKALSHIIKQIDILDDKITEYIKSQ